jgi:hypothetical protein
MQWMALAQPTPTMTRREGPRIDCAGRGSKAVRMFAMQLLTWGTIVGAIGSAFLLAALERPSGQFVVASPLGALLQLPGEPTQAGNPKLQVTRPVKKSVSPAGSAPQTAGR